MDMARGPLMLRLSLRPMPGWDMVDSMATDLALVMVVMAMAVLDTATERGLLMLRPSPRPMPGWDMVDSTAMVLALAMAVMAMVDSDTDMARGLLMPRLSPSTDMVAFTATDSQLMAATAMDLDSMARSKQNQIPRLTIS